MRVGKKILSRLPPCNKRLSKTQHVQCGLVDLNKHAIVNLSKTEKLENLSRLRRNAVDTGINALFGFCDKMPNTYPRILTTKATFGSSGT